MSNSKCHSRRRSILPILGLLLIVTAPIGAIERHRETTGMPLNVWATLAGVASAPLYMYMADPPNLYDYEGLGFAWQGDRITLGVDFVLNNDHAYTPSETYMFGRYIDLLDGRVETQLGDVSLTAGRITHRDEIPGPYSLFISSADLPHTVVDLRYDNGFFFYNTRWIELNRQSSIYTYRVPVLDAGGPTGDYIELPLDRGANYKVYGMDFGDFRVGLQESIVYLYRSFYPEYFLSPLPMYFTQLVNSTRGKPWTQIANENSMMGFFADYTFDSAYVFGQFLVDDWNDAFFGWILEDEHDQPAKFGWSLGGIIDVGVGTLGLYQAGATKYTFEPTYANAAEYPYSAGIDFNPYPYSYTYYPVTRYWSDDEWKPILPEDNYIGYLHGENNVAFAATFDSEAFGINYDAMLEYTISGAKSPANPWHEDDWHSNQRTQLLDSERLEHRLLLSLGGEYWLGPMRISGSLRLGGVWNELELVEIVADESPIFVPSDTNRFLWEAALELHFALGVGDPRDQADE